MHAIAYFAWYRLLASFRHPALLPTCRPTYMPTYLPTIQYSTTCHTAILLTVLHADKSHEPPELSLIFPLPLVPSATRPASTCTPSLCSRPTSPSTRSPPKPLVSTHPGSAVRTASLCAAASELPSWIDQNVSAAGNVISHVQDLVDPTQLGSRGSRRTSCSRAATRTASTTESTTAFTTALATLFPRLWWPPSEAAFSGP